MVFRRSLHPQAAVEQFMAVPRMGTAGADEDRKQEDPGPALFESYSYVSGSWPLWHVLIVSRRLCGNLLRQ